MVSCGAELPNPDEHPNAHLTPQAQATVRANYSCGGRGSVILTAALDTVQAFLSAILQLTISSSESCRFYQLWWLYDERQRQPRLILIFPFLVRVRHLALCISSQKKDLGDPFAGVDLGRQRCRIRNLD